MGGEEFVKGGSGPGWGMEMGLGFWKPATSLIVKNSLG